MYEMHKIKQNFALIFKIINAVIVEVYARSWPLKQKHIVTVGGRCFGLSSRSTLWLWVAVVLASQAEAHCDWVAVVLASQAEAHCDCGWPLFWHLKQKHIVIVGGRCFDHSIRSTLWLLVAIVWSLKQKHIAIVGGHCFDFSSRSTVCLWVAVVLTSQAKHSVSVGGRCFDLSSEAHCDCWWPLFWPLKQKHIVAVGVRCFALKVEATIVRPIQELSWHDTVLRLILLFTTACR